MNVPEPVTLRPLGIGEIFDRAIALFVRNFVLFTLMVLIVVVPLGVLQYALTPNQTALLQKDIQIIKHPPKATPGHPPVFNNPYFAPAELERGGVLLLLTLLLLPIATNMVALGVAALYARRIPDLRSCFETVIRRWPRLIGVVALEACALLGAYIGGVLVLTILFVIGSVFVRLLLPFAIIIFIVAVLGLLALLVLMVMLVIAASFGLFGVTMENLHVVPAFSAGITRIFNRAELKKAFLMSLAYAALQIGVIVVSLTASLLFLLVLKNSILQVAFATIVNAILSAFLTVLLAVYYYDVRIRREGFDLEADLQRLSTP